MGIANLPLHFLSYALIRELFRMWLLNKAEVHHVVKDTTFKGTKINPHRAAEPDWIPRDLQAPDSQIEEAPKEGETDFVKEGEENPDLTYKQPEEPIYSKEFLKKFLNHKNSFFQNYFDSIGKRIMD
jgi:hypothetical protein